MAGSSLKIRTGTFSKFTNSLSLPFLENRVLEFIMGNDATQSTRNIASLGSPSSVVGSVSYGDHHAVVGPGGGFDLGLPFPNSDLTIICVAQRISGSLPGFLVAGGYTGFLNYMNRLVLYNAGGGSETSMADFNVPTHTDYFCAIGTLPLGVKQKIHLWTDGVRAENEAEFAGGSSRSGTEIMKIATNTVSFIGGGTANLAYVAMFSGIFSTAQLDAVYASLKNFYDGKIVIS